MDKFLRNRSNGGKGAQIMDDTSVSVVEQASSSQSAQQSKTPTSTSSGGKGKGKGTKREAQDRTPSPGPRSESPRGPKPSKGTEFGNQRWNGPTQNFQPSWNNQWSQGKGGHKGDFCPSASWGYSGRGMPQSQWQPGGKGCWGPSSSWYGGSGDNNLTWKPTPTKGFQKGGKGKGKPSPQPSSGVPRLNISVEQAKQNGQWCKVCHAMGYNAYHAEARCKYAPAGLRDGTPLEGGGTSPRVEA